MDDNIKSITLKVFSFLIFLSFFKSFFKVTQSFPWSIFEHAIYGPSEPFCVVYMMCVFVVRESSSIGRA